MSGAKPMLRTVFTILVWLALGGIFTPASASFEDDKRACINSPALASNLDGQPDACSRQINSGRWKGNDLAIMLRNRGLSYLARYDRKFNPADIDLAIADFSKSIQINPAYVVAFKSRAVAYGKKSDVAAQIRDYGEVIRLKPLDTQALFSRGTVYYQSKDYIKSIDDFTSVIKLQPDSSAAYVRRGEARSSNGDGDLAFADFDMALQIQPGNWAALGDRAGIFKKRGLMDRALADLNEAIKVNPTVFYQVYEMRGDILLERGNAEGAIEDFTRAVGGAGLWKRFPYLKRGNAYMSIGDLDRAMSDYDQANKTLFGQDAKFLQAKVKRGIAEEKRGNRDDAISDYKASLELEAKDDLDRQAIKTARERLAELSGEKPVTAPIKEGSTSPSNKVTAVATIERLPAVSHDRRIALVIGNSRYKNAPVLSNPSRDAATVADALKLIGFETVILQTDLDREALLLSLRDFARQAETADWAMVYYAGHGMEVGGINYLVPVDAKISVDRDIGFEAVPLEQVLNAAERAKKLRLVILDACRDNPFANQMKRTLTVASRSVSRGLAAVEPDAGTLVVYAAKDGETAFDGDDVNSPFAVAFVKNLQRPGLEVRRLFDFVRDDVMEATERKQKPFSYGSISGKQDFYFVAAK
jgi:tetratricopeptide (TPR) repeat protein